MLYNSNLIWLVLYFPKVYMLGCYYIGESRVSELSCSTVNADALAIDPFRFLGRQETDRACDIKWEPISIERRCMCCSSLHLIHGHIFTTRNIMVSNLVKHVGHSTSWCNSIDSDTFLATVFG